MGKYLVAVDVGTGSARAGIFDRRGRGLGRSAFPIAMKVAEGRFAEHDSAEIWKAVCRAVRGAREDAAVDAADIAAIGFDATCSLVVRDAAGDPLSVIGDGEPGWDTIAWLDHRAIDEAEALTALGGRGVRHAGGTLSPEMQLPKLLWLKRRRPDIWGRAGMIFDLADFLTWRATGSLRRSICTLTAKWSWLAHDAEGWPAADLEAAGLGDLVERAGIADQPVRVGASPGRLTAAAAAELGLKAGIVVAAGMVDAYAGQLALLGSDPEPGDQIGLIGGTSSCLMRFCDATSFLPTIWGPYRDVVLPGRWVVEGGQSATGALLDHIVRTFGNGLDPTPGTHALVLDRIEQLIDLKGSRLGAGIHIVPDFHGNRAPIGDARLTGVVHGLTLDGSFDGMCAIYYRAMVALALGIRQILELMETAGAVGTIHLGGGHARNGSLARLYADACRRRVAVASGEEAMLLGTAIAAAAASGLHASLDEACRAMARPSTVIEPNEIRAEGLDRDYRIFLRMQEHRREIAALA
jgi:hypothetical protein